MTFCSIQQHLIRNICVKFVIRNLSQSPDIEQSLDGSISNFQVSGKSLINENCDNSRTNDDNDMKLRNP